MTMCFLIMVFSVCNVITIENLTLLFWKQQYFLKGKSIFYGKSCLIFHTLE